MSVIVEAFRLKPFDLEPVYQSWPSAPIFQGVLSRDPPVDDWLKQIKEGSTARGVPKEYWHKVGQHYLGARARARFDELKAVMKNMHGGKYHWNWKRFKLAMAHMGCEYSRSSFLRFLTFRGIVDIQSATIQGSYRLVKNRDSKSRYRLVSGGSWK